MKVFLCCVLTLFTLVNGSDISSQSCGVKTGNAVHPWVFRFKIFTNYYESSCHGVLITEQYALAPHNCFGSYEDVKNGNTRVKAIFKDGNEQEEEIEVAEIKKFAPKVPGESPNLALVKLASSVDQKVYPPACLPTSKPHGNLVFLNEDYENTNLVMVEVPIQLYNNQRCKQEYLSSSYQYPLQSDNFCVTGDQEYTCAGTGLGLIFQNDGYQYYIAGVFSTTICNSGLRSGFTRVYDYRDQISDMLSGKDEELVTLFPLLPPLSDYDD